MKASRSLSLFFALSLLISATACGGDDKKSTNTDAINNTALVTDAITEEEDTSIRISDVLSSELDFNQEEVRFLVELGWSGNERMLTSLYVAEDSPDVVDSAVYNRNLAVQDYLNVKIVEPTTTEVKDLLKEVRKVIRTGDDVYDIVGAYQAYSVSGSALNYFYDFEDVPYVNIEQPYWATQYIKDMSYNGTYWVTGDNTTLYTGGFFGTFVNKRIWNNLAQDDNLYDLVREGNWTLDKMKEYAQMAYEDVNNNGITDLADQVGLAYSNVDNLIISCGVEYTTRDNDGTPSLSLMSERTTTIWSSISKLIEETPGVMNIADATEGTDYEYADHMGLYFSQGSCLFISDPLYKTIDEMRNMEDDFYLIPCPKYDENQENYITQITDDCTIFAIPITSQNLERNGAVLEAMAIESYRTLRPAYYETALKDKYTRDAESAEMLDLIRSSVTTDFGMMYSESIGGGIGKTGSGIHRIFRTADNNNTNTIASLYEKNRAKYEKNFEALLEAFNTQAEE